MGIGNEFLKLKQKFKQDFIKKPAKIDVRGVKKNKKYTFKRYDNTLSLLTTKILRNTGNKEKELKSFDSTGTKLLLGTLLIAIALLGIKKFFVNEDKGILPSKSKDVPEPYFPTISPQIPKSDKSAGTVSEKMLNYIKSTESLRLEAYKPTKGEAGWTIGYGHHKGDVKAGDKITKEQAEELFRKDVQEAADDVNKLVKVPLSQNQFDALVSFRYNVRPTTFRKFLESSKLNEQNYELTAKKLLLYNKGYNQNTKQYEVLPGLAKRREYESNLFKSDINETPTQKTKPHGATNTEGYYVGNYQIEKGVQLSPQIETVLKRTGGSGRITSGIRANDANTKTSHKSGNKFDVGLRNLSYAKVIDTAVPFMKDPAIAHVAFEGFGDPKRRNTAESNRISKALVETIKQRYPDIAQRINSGKLKIYHWGWDTKASGPHLDILIDPTQSSELSTANKNEILAKDNIWKVTKTKPDKPKTVKNKNISNASLDNTKSKILIGNVGRVNPIYTYKNTYS